jgi:hypothetical protein
MGTVLLFGTVCLGAGVRFAARPSPRWLGFTGAMWLTVLTAVGHAILTNVSSVCRFLEDRERVADSEVTRVFFAGIKEASRPGALGGLFLTLAALCVAVGVLRARWGEERV